MDNKERARLLKLAAVARGEMSMFPEEQLKQNYFEYKKVGAKLAEAVYKTAMQHIDQLMLTKTASVNIPSNVDPLTSAVAKLLVYYKDK